MSVIKEKRHTAERFQIAVDAECLFIKIYNIYMSRNIGKRHRPYLCSRIINKIMTINDCIRTANVLNLYEEYDRRHELQVKAIMLMEELMVDLELSAHVIENLNHEKVALTLRDCKSLLSKLENWTEGDSKRVKKN